MYNHNSLIMLNILLICSGLFSEIFLFSIFLLCWKLDKRFQLHKDAISYFGSVKKTARLFNTSLIFYTLLRIMFLSSILSHFSLWSQPDIILLIIFACIGIILAAFISLDKNYLLHNLSGLSVAGLSIVFIFIFGIHLFTIAYIPAILCITLALSMLILSIYYIYIKKTINGMYELSFFILILSWDILITLLIFQVIK